MSSTRLVFQDGLAITVGVSDLYRHRRCHVAYTIFASPAQVSSMSLCATYENWLRERLRNGRVRIKNIKISIFRTPHVRVFMRWFVQQIVRVFT